jgi:TetR/AcrR family transcriptional regulator, transcriptional repressor for nem operon
MIKTERSVFLRVDGAPVTAQRTKGAATRQRIVELAAPVFNERGYVGASMRDLVDATGLEKGGIYNHFGSKEQLALEAYDHAMSLVTDGLQRSQKAEHDAIQRLQSMARSFATAARNPVISGGCPIMNTAIEADDTHAELRERARASMSLWHRLIGRIVKDGVAAGTVAADTDPYALASVLTSALEGGLMLARLYDDPAHMDRVIAHLTAYIETLRVSDVDPPVDLRESS